MTEQEALAKMIAPGTRRPRKYREGVIQIHLTRACNIACFNCTQASHLGGKADFMTPEQFGQVVESLRGYFGVVGVFGGNPAMSPHFVECCRVLRDSWVPQEQRGLWCNDLLTIDKAAAARITFNPKVSNLNVHLSQQAWDRFKLYWPEAQPFGLTQDSRHSPPWVAMKDVLRKPCPAGCLDGYVPTDRESSDCGRCGGTGEVYDEARAWELISDCDINKHWSAMIGVFRGQLRAWFCEIAGAQSILHQDDPDYPDTGLDPTKLVRMPGWKSLPVNWWQLPMEYFDTQVRKHCHDCGVPLRGYGELAQAEDRAGTEQVSRTHVGVYRLKRSDRALQVVTELEQIGVGRLQRMTDYIGNAKR